MLWNGVDKIGRVLAPVLVYFLVSNIIVIGWTSAGLHDDAALLTGITAVVVLPLFVWWYKNDCTGRGEDAKLRGANLCGRQYLAIAAFGVACNAALTLVMNLLIARLHLANDAQEALFAGNWAAQLIGVGFLTPVAEEVLFRGLVYNRLKGYTKEVWAVLGAAALFALWHGNTVQMLFAFPMGLLLIWLYRRWESLTAPVVFHMAVNISSILMTAYAVHAG